LGRTDWEALESGGAGASEVGTDPLEKLEPLLFCVGFSSFEHLLELYECRGKAYVMGKDGADERT